MKNRSENTKSKSRMKAFEYLKKGVPFSHGTYKTSLSLDSISEYLKKGVTYGTHTVSLSSDPIAELTAMAQQMNIDFFFEKDIKFRELPDSRAPTEGTTWYYLSGKEYSDQDKLVAYSGINEFDNKYVFYTSDGLNLLGLPTVDENSPDADWYLFNNLFNMNFGITYEIWSDIKQNGAQFGLAAMDKRPGVSPQPTPPPP